MKNGEVFQADSKIVNECYDGYPNYLVERDVVAETVDRQCVLYFSSHNIYYLNNEETFIRQIKERSFFEWYQTRVAGVAKHIFLRDIKKQWYLTGINHEINNPERLLAFLEEETRGYRLITVGRSAGGYAAVVCGYLLSAEKVCVFNGQFDLTNRLRTSREGVDPILFREKLNPKINQFYNIKKFIKLPTKSITSIRVSAGKTACSLKASLS